MALTVNTNLSAMRAANALNVTQGKLSHTLAKISTGLRVTKAADDAAGSAVASNLHVGPQDAASKGLPTNASSHSKRTQACVGTPSDASRQTHLSYAKPLPPLP